MRGITVPTTAREVLIVLRPSILLHVYDAPSQRRLASCTHSPFSIPHSPFSMMRPADDGLPRALPSQFFHRRCSGTGAPPVPSVSASHWPWDSVATPHTRPPQSPACRNRTALHH